MVQIAVKTSIGVFYFACPCMFSVLLSERGELTREEFKNAWKSMQNEFSHSIQTVHLRYQTVESIQTRLQNNNVFFIAGRRAEDSGEDVLYFSARSPRSEVLVAEVRGVMPAQTLHVTCKTELQQLAPLFIQALNFLLTTSH
jgi:AP-1 complex subunit beta-1